MKQEDMYPHQYLWLIIKKTILPISIFILVIVSLFNSYFIVNPGERGILLTLGNPSQHIYAEGFHLKFPYVQNAVIMNIQTLKYAATASAASKDLQIVSSAITTNYRLNPESVLSVYTNIGVDYENKLIQPLEQESVKSVTAQFTAEELITKRESVRVLIHDLLASKLVDKGIIVQDVSITNFDFSESFNQAIEAKVTAEQLKLKAQNDLERIKVEALQKVAVANGSAQSAIIEAQGQATAIELINNQLRNSPEYTRYLATTKWNGILPTVTGGAIPFISLPNTTGVTQ